jgi:hypothetical protein
METRLKEGLKDIYCSLLIELLDCSIVRGTLGGLEAGSSWPSQCPNSASPNWEPSFTPIHGFTAHSLPELSLNYLARSFTVTPWSHILKVLHSTVLLWNLAHRVSLRQSPPGRPALLPSR